MSQSTISESLPEISSEKFQEKKQPYSSSFCPRFLGKVNIYQDYMILSHEGQDFTFQTNSQSRDSLKKLFLIMDGSKSLSELQETFAPNNPEILHTFLHRLDDQGFLDDVSSVRVNTGIDTLLEIEDLTQELLSQTINLNRFFHSSNIPINVLYGFAIENYHLLSQRNMFITPVLSFQASAQIRQLMNEYYQQENGQEKLLLEALDKIGISSEDLDHTIPLPETMSLCNGFIYWSSFDPYFFLTTLDTLIRQIQTSFELYLKAYEQVQIDNNFIHLIKEFLKTQQQLEQNNLTHRIFSNIPHIEIKTKQRFRSQTYLYIEMYNNFYTAIEKYYSSTKQLLRQVSSI